MKLQTPEPLRLLLACRTVVPSWFPSQKCLLHDVQRLEYVSWGLCTSHGACALARLARLISQIADAIVICFHPFVLAAHKRFYIRRKVLLERCFIGAFCHVFATLAFGQHRVFVLSSD